MPDRSVEAFRRWLDGPNSHRWLEAEQRVVAELVNRRIGGHAIQLGLGGHSLIDPIPAAAHHVLRYGSEGEFGGPIHSPGDELPLQSDSVHLVLVHHLQALVPRPANLLSEVARILVAGGVAVFFGLSPAMLGSPASEADLAEVRRRWPAALARSLRQAGLDVAACRSVTPGTGRVAGAQRWVSRRLSSLGVVFAAGPGYSLKARKPDSTAPILDRRVLQSGRINGAVGGSPARGV